MAQTDRNAGLVANAAIKSPCLVATTADITLSGAQTIDGVSVVTGDRVLVKDQADQTENGIYEADSSAWVRTKDSNGAYDLVTGSLVFVRSGTAGAGWWYCTTADTIVIGTDNITWERSSTALATISAFMQTVIDDPTAVAARQTLLLDKSGANIVSAATIDLDAATGDIVDVTGTNPISAITLADGVEKTVRFTGSLLLSNGASLELKDNADWQTAAGDTVVFRGDSGGVVRMIDYQRLNSQGADIASAATLNLDLATGDIIDVTGTDAITAITLAQGRRRTVRFTDALVLTNGASLLLPGEANITTVAGDFGEFIGYAGGVVRCKYSRLSGDPIIGGARVGDLAFSFASSRAGYLLMYGQTLGNSSSGAVEASEDYDELFAHLWDTLADAEAPVSGGRGASAAADFAADKTITLVDGRGRLLLGKDNMGGASANVVTDTEADTIGDVGGDEEETQTLSTLVNHDHNSFNDNAGAITAGGGIGQAGLSDATGGGAAMNIMNPYLTINLFIRY